jgi:hypothetical protein
MLSPQTRLLATAHAQALRDLRAHRRSCGTCLPSLYGQARQCPAARDLAAAERNLLEQVREARQADHIAAPGQQALF